MAAAREPPSQGQRYLLLVLRSPEWHTLALCSEMPMFEHQHQMPGPKRRVT